MFEKEKRNSFSHHLSTSDEGEQNCNCLPRLDPHLKCVEHLLDFSQMVRLSFSCSSFFCYCSICNTQMITGYLFKQLSKKAEQEGKIRMMSLNAEHGPISLSPSFFLSAIREWARLFSSSECPPTLDRTGAIVLQK